MEKFFQKGVWQFSIRHLFRRVFLEDWLIKVIALFITVALWLGVTGLRAPTTERLRDVTLKPRVSDTIEATDISVQEVDLLVTGDKRKIDQIKEENLIVVLDLTDVQAGDRTIQITSENVNVELPTGVRLEEVQPNKIAVKLETVTEREIAVKVEIEGAVSENFEVYSKTVAPQKVRVRGPESFIKSLDSVPTEKVSLGNRREDFTAQRIPLNIADSKVSVLDTNVVDVAFRIGEKRIERLFTVPVQTATEKKTATVILYGGRSVLESLKAENLRVEIVKNEAGETSLNLVLPPELQEKFEIRKLKIN
ncbi:MAG: CdaR family protein [Acidobacteriota bacterium]|nr:CdaR family protein [Acidobacteriota bacterium]